ncbi:EamA family transporter [Maribellus comscasis]|uniref:EamA family transporter n=1 Tax=Maribellus comscasis TaxID=2681766 RepID=A0A6I6JH19_9BACT|nr:EamA family transporter [Maribellus comscasis]QGY42096.1 EamA family transporter [Maribellus comscasis]
MIYLFASIISSTSIYIIFRWAKNYSCNLTHLITVNYVTATIFGAVLFSPSESLFTDQTKSWLPFALLLGILFTGLFFLIGNSSQKAGITVTTLANKLSLVFPVLFSLLFFNEKISTLKYVGLISSFAAIMLTVYKKEIKKTNVIYILLPVSIFIGSGFADSIVKYVQTLKTSPEQIPVFTTCVFFVAFVFALLFSVRNGKKVLNALIPTVLLGILLGIANFGSLYFLMNALSSDYLESSLIFAVNNMSIVALSAIVGYIIFNEKLNKINYAGLALAFVSLYFLT